jgi:hypothetical protein
MAEGRSGPFSFNEDLKAKERYLGGHRSGAEGPDEVSISTTVAPSVHRFLTCDQITVDQLTLGCM